MATTSAVIVFDRTTKKVISYAGPVPVMLENDGLLESFDGATQYGFVATDYR